MTNKEAYQLIESCLEYAKDMSETPEAYVEAIRLAKEVFDKQEPVKPDIYPSGRFYIFECSECGITVSGVNKYCHKCGQKLDRED